jgi:hypothetical protein
MTRGTMAARFGETNPVGYGLDAGSEEFAEHPTASLSMAASMTWELHLLLGSEVQASQDGLDALSEQHRASD